MLGYKALNSTSVAGMKTFFYAKSSLSYEARFLLKSRLDFFLPFFDADFADVLRVYFVAVAELDLVTFFLVLADVWLFVGPGLTLLVFFSVEILLVLSGVIFR